MPIMLYIPSKITSPINSKVISWDSTNNSYHIYPGNYQIDQTIVISANTKLIVHPGVIIDLINRAGIISYSPVSIIGESYNPITITSSDKSSQGIAVINSSQPSYIAYSSFSGLSSFSQPIHTTGSLTLYRSKVNISNCFINNSQSEDALNLINSEFDLDQLSISQSAFDAIDADFSSGTIGSLKFRQIGNDAIDFSQSQANIDIIDADGVGDKAVSVGESSVINLKDLNVKNSNIAIAVKDLSQVKLDNLSVQNTQVGVAVYHKKAEYGPAGIKIGSTNFAEVTEPYVVEKDSLIKFPTTILEGNDENLKDRFL